MDFVFLHQHTLLKLKFSVVYHIRASLKGITLDLCCQEKHSFLLVSRVIFE